METVEQKNVFPSPEGSDYSCPTLQGLNNEYVDYCVVVSFMCSQLYCGCMDKTLNVELYLLFMFQRCFLFC